MDEVRVCLAVSVGVTRNALRLRNAFTVSLRASRLVECGAVSGIREGLLWSCLYVRVTNAFQLMYAHGDYRLVALVNGSNVCVIESIAL